MHPYTDREKGLKGLITLYKSKNLKGLNEGLINPFKKYLIF